MTTTPALGADKATDERALFERTMNEVFGDDENFDRDDNGRYINRAWQDAYVGWIHRASLAAVPVSEPVAYWDKAVGGFYIAGAVIPEKVKDRITPLYAAAPAPVSGMPDLVGQIRALRTPNVLIANSESYIEGFAKAREMAADLAALPAPQAPDTTTGETK